MAAEKERIQYIDIAKGIAILCIILGHLNSLRIARVVFTFHVPIFFFITGYFTNDRLPVKAFIKRKARMLLVPYVFTCLVIILLAALEYGLFFGAGAAWKAALEWSYAAAYGAGDSYTSPFYIKSIGAIWFLWALFWGSIFLRASLALRKEQRILAVVALFFLGYASRALFWFPFSIQAGCCATLFLYIGWLVKKGEGWLKGAPGEVKTAIAVFALITWLSFMKDFQSFWLVHCDIGRGIIDIFGCLCGSGIVLLVSWYIDRHFPVVAGMLRAAGRYSLLVLGLHIMELNTFPWWQVTGELVRRGLPAWMQIYVIIAGKALLIFPAAFICLRWGWIRRLFGYGPLPTEAGPRANGKGV